MKVVLLSLVLVLAGVAAFAPVASAEPCEVPGCQVAGAVLCIVTESGGNPKQLVGTLADCMTGPAGP